MGDFIDKENSIELQVLNGGFNRFNKVPTNFKQKKEKKFKYGANDFDPHDRTNWDFWYKKKRK